MRAKQAVAIIVCVAIVAAAYAVWNRTTSSFNPSPTTFALDTGSSCSPAAVPCPAFRILSANLSVKTQADITSQELTLKISALGPSPIGRLGVFFSNFALGNLSKTLPQGQTSIEGWAIPTTITVDEGKTYSVSVEAAYLDPTTGQVAASYWQTVQVVAH